LNRALGGGLPYGRQVLIWGSKSSAKSSEPIDHKELAKATTSIVLDAARCRTLEVPEEPIVAKAKDDAAKAAVKAAELEKAKADAANRVNELTAELARLRDGSELKDALAKAKKAEADLEAASIALREANAKAAAATARLAELEEENRRLREQSKGANNVSPNYRAL
jgi:predicted  nucleic acid-binding Zn-ribbon protein